MDSDTRESVANAMLDAMGDNEFYCASYASKEEPHLEGLLQTLSDSLRQKERELQALRDSGVDLTPIEIAKKIFRRLIFSGNRRMHKGFPEMLTYLLNKPMYYASHKFVPVVVQHIIHKGCQSKVTNLKKQ